MQRVLLCQALKFDGCLCWQYLNSHVLGKLPVIMCTNPNPHFFNFLKAKLMDLMFTVSIGRLVFTAAAASAVLGGS